MKDDTREVWRELCRPVFDAVSREPAEGFELAFDWFKLGALNFVRMNYSATRLCRTPQHVRTGDADLLVLHLLLRGREDVDVDGTPVVMAPDRVVLIDWSRPFTRVASATEQLSMAIPRHLLPQGERLYDEGPVLVWKLDTIAGMMLANALTGLWAGLPHWDQQDTVPVTSGFLGLLGGLIEAKLGDTPDPNIFRPATLAAMKSYLNSRLSEPSLGADDLVRAFHCSRSSVYRLFYESGGVNAYIREQRLAGCLHALSHTHRTRSSVGQVARAYGFEDTAYFHRVFKKRFGATPGEAAKHSETHRPASGQIQGMDPMRTIHRWLGIATR